MRREVDVRALAAAHRDGALVANAREPYEYVTGHVPGAGTGAWASAGRPLVTGTGRS